MLAMWTEGEGGTNKKAKKKKKNTRKQYKIL